MPNNQANRKTAITAGSGNAILKKFNGSEIQLNETAELQKINLVHLSAGPGGLEVLLPQIVSGLSRRLFHAFVIRSRPEGTNVYHDSAINVQYGHDSNFVAAWETFLFARKHRKEIFHVFNIGPLFLLLLKLGGARRLVYSIHGTIYWRSWWQKIIYRTLWKLALSNKYRLVANSEYSRNVFVEKISSRAEIRVLYNPIDGERFNLHSGATDKKQILIVYAGRLAEGKNLTRWIEIATWVHSQMPATRFEIFGKGALESELREQIVRSGAEDFIHLMGFRKDPVQIYQKADLLLFLSEYESFGNVVAECILCGTPVLASPIPAMKEVFRDFPEFLIAENNDWKSEVMDRLNKLSSLKNTALAARESFLRRFAKEVHLSQLDKIYHEFD